MTSFNLISIDVFKTDSERPNLEINIFGSWKWLFLNQNLFSVSHQQYFFFLCLDHKNRKSTNVTPFPFIARLKLRQRFEFWYVPDPPPKKNAQSFLTNHFLLVIHSCRVLSLVPCPLSQSITASVSISQTGDFGQESY